MQWPLEKCASLTNAYAGPVTRELLVSTETQTHLHLNWQCLTFRECSAKASSDAAREGMVPAGLKHCHSRCKCVCVSVETRSSRVTGPA
eukprot:2071881-Pleurochrysis_carterae.AAC.2